MINTKNQNRTGNRILKTSLVWAVLIIAIAAMFLLAVIMGSSRLSLGEIFDVFAGKAGKTQYAIVMTLRVPRAVLAIIVGACLSVAGALLQAVMKNPLADPGSIGVSAGASTAAITVLLLFPNLSYSVPLFAFAGAALACVLIYLVAWK